MKILITHSYFLRFDKKQWDLKQPYPPLGTLYAAALLRDNGYDISFYDTMFTENPGNICDVLSKFQPELLVIYDDGFNYLTKMCLTNMREASYEMIRLAKDLGIKVAVSSSDSSDHYEKYLEQGADFVIIGEAEMTLLELASSLKNSDLSLENIPGLAFRSRGNLVKTPGRPLIKDLDGLPFPAWDLADMEIYRNFWEDGNGYFSINMATTRGCPFKCNWCAKPIYGNRYHSRSPQSVVNEIIFLKEKYAIDHIWFCDDIFGLKPGWVNEFSMLMQAAQININYKIQCRADLLLKENNIKALADSGCNNVWIGAESGSQKILDAMDKGITIDQIREATGLLKKYKIQPSFFIQFGYPGETKEDIRLTLKMINSLLPSSIGISISYPLPGTLFHERVKEELKVKSNWTDSDELMLMFKNTYRPAFYKQLHRYVQRNHRMQLALLMIKHCIKYPFSITFQSLKKIVTLVYYVPATILARFKLKLLEESF